MIQKPLESSQRETVLSPWVTVVSNVIQGHSGPEEFHCIRQADYVTAFCVTADGRVPLVRQYRPAVHEVTLELPGGLLEAGESADPASAAMRELEEEVGYRVVGGMIPLGVLFPDTGRLENKLYGYFSSNILPITDWTPEPNTERCLVSIDELIRLVDTGEFKHALNMAVVAAAILRGLLSPYIAGSFQTEKNPT